MKTERIFEAIETASGLIARLDARISATPWAEAWHIRSTFYAAEKLAAVDGTPTQSGDIVRLMMSAPLPSPDAYLPATIGFGHWRRCLARMQFTEATERLLGRSVSPSQAAAETQTDWDWEDALSPAVRKAVASQAGQIETVDSYALEVSENALIKMRAYDAPGSAYHSLAKALREAIRVDPDPDYFKRIHRLRLKFETDVRDHYAFKGNSPSPPDVDQAAEFLASVNWDRKPHLGACFSVVPDRLQEMGLTENRLSCLTGATKRLGFERRLDDRAFVSFLNQLAEDAKAGLAIFDDLETQMRSFSRAFKIRFDKNSPLPLILYSFLVLPAISSPWLQRSLDLLPGVTNKNLKQLEALNLIVQWERSSSGAGRPTIFWAGGELTDAFRTASIARARQRGSGAIALPSPAEMLRRYADLDVSIPMAIVYDRHEKELIDLDKLYGRFFDRNWLKNRSSRKLAESENEA